MISGDMGCQSRVASVFMQNFTSIGPRLYDLVQVVMSCCKLDSNILFARIGYSCDFYIGVTELE